MRTALNEVTRAAYVKDCDIGVQRWNRLIEEAGHDFRLALPSPRFRRSVGAWAGDTCRSAGQADRRRRVACPAMRLAALPSRIAAFVASLMQRVTEPGKFAGWIAPPDGGINNLGLAYEYVRLN